MRPAVLADRLRLEILAVGRCRDAAINALVDDYARRCPWPWHLTEVTARAGTAPAQLTAAEGRQLLAAVPAGAAVIALDERGQDLDSLPFARRLGTWRDDGRPAAAFLIGGADGLAAEPRQRADLVLAMGRMTWPHLLARVMLAEQLYRATTILAGHPYHRA